MRQANYKPQEKETREEKRRSFFTLSTSYNAIVGTPMFNMYFSGWTF